MNKPRKPNIVHITVEGDVGCGKSTVMLELKKMIEERFEGTVVLAGELRYEDSLANEVWMQQSIKKTIWVLNE